MTDPERHRPDVEYAIAQGAPNLFNLDVSSSEIVLWVNNPGHLSLSLRVLTTFPFADSETVTSLQRFAEVVAVQCRGGKVLHDELSFEVRNPVSSPYLEVQVGPSGTYANRTASKKPSRSASVNPAKDLRVPMMSSLRFVRFLFWE